MDQDDETTLPASIAVAWGLRERPTKGPRPGLSVPRIVEAAIKIAVADGLQAVSMSRVAAYLGVSTMSLYRYVAAKDELLVLMVDAALGTPPEPPPSQEGWRVCLGHWARALLDGYRRNPWVLRVPVSGPPSTPNQIDWLEQGLRCLRGTELDEGEKLSAILLISSLARNEATLAASLHAAFKATGSTPQQSMSAFGRMLGKLIDAERYPAFHAVLAAGVFDKPDDPDEEFLFGLDRVFDGIEVLIRGRGAEARP